MVNETEMPMFNNFLKGVLTMSRKWVMRSSLLTILLAFPMVVFSYEIRTHEAITKEAIKNSLYGSTILSSLGLKIGQQLPNLAPMDCAGESDGCNFLGRESERNYADLILNGSSSEDLIPSCRPFNHFYDPANNRGLTVTTFGTYDVTIRKLGNSNPSWAMKTNLLPFSFPSCFDEYTNQQLSYPDAYEALYNAITLPTTDRSKINYFYSKLFQSLGQVLHLLQDMAAIEHVRNDSHLAAPYFESTIDAMIKEKSRFELYTEWLVKRKSLSFEGYTSNIPVNFSKPLDYWVTATGSNVGSGKGLSEFTNTNFFSQSTNLRMRDEQPVTTYYDLPRPHGDRPIVDYPVRALFISRNIAFPTELEKICPISASSMLEDCWMGFVTTQVTDNLTGQLQLNKMASTFSIFDIDLQYVGTASMPCEYNIDVPKCGIPADRTDRKFALNRFNFDEMHKFLIPRAVAYSAGLLKHFFRGKLEISRPDTGFYFDVDSIVDQSYTKVSLQAQNTTEQAGSWAQDMSGGNIEVVVRYTLPNNTEEKVSNSSKQTTTLLVGDAPSKLTFDLSTPVPVDAENVNLYLVYRGTLGEETDVVAVSRLEINDDPFKLEVSLPDEGVYSIIDHATINQRGQGFEKLKLNFRLAPIKANGKITPETLTGTLGVQANYSPNNCYASDLTGEYSLEAYTQRGAFERWNGCNGWSGATTNAANNQASITSNYVTKQPLAFNFVSPIPINAADLSLELGYVFQIDGKSAKARLVQDISEPTYFSFINSTDYFHINGQFYTKEQIAQNINDTLKWVDFNHSGTYEGAPDDYSLEPMNSYVAIKFNNLSTKPLAEIPSLAGLSYIRVAFLGNAQRSTSLHISYGRDKSNLSTYVINRANVVSTAKSVSLFEWVRGTYQWNFINLYAILDAPEGTFPSNYWEIFSILPDSSLNPQPMTITFP
jgi:hypothetical protein